MLEPHNASWTQACSGALGVSLDVSEALKGQKIEVCLFFFFPEVSSSPSQPYPKRIPSPGSAPLKEIRRLLMLGTFSLLSC